MRFGQASALLLLTASIADAQAPERDSLSSLTPSARYAEICPGPRDPDTGAIVGRVRNADDTTALSNATVSAEWLDVNLSAGRPSARHASTSARTSGGGLYLLCGVPVGVRLNLRTEHTGFVASPAQLALGDGLIGNVDFALGPGTGAASDATTSESRRAQQLAPVAVTERAPSMSLAEMDGFETRRHIGMGAFVTDKDIAKHDFPDLTSVLIGVRGLHIEWGRAGRPMPYLKGMNSVSASGPYCVPNFYLDGAPFSVTASVGGGPVINGRLQPQAGADVLRYSDLAALAIPGQIRGIEVYSNPGNIPAQYDMTSSTGCGSIVIWTR